MLHVSRELRCDGRPRRRAWAGCRGSARGGAASCAGYARARGGQLLRRGAATKATRTRLGRRAGAAARASAGASPGTTHVPAMRSAAELWDTDCDCPPQAPGVLGGGSPLAPATCSRLAMAVSLETSAGSALPAVQRLSNGLSPPPPSSLSATHTALSSPLADDSASSLHPCLRCPAFSLPTTNTERDVV